MHASKPARFRSHTGALLALCISAGGCSADTPITGADPQAAPLVRTFLNVSYANTSPAQRLDLYLPEEGSGPFPLVIWIHGGGWSSGSRALDAASPQRQLTTRGYAVASVDYRLSGVARYPAAVLDVKAAVRFLRANAASYSIQKEKIAAWGSSAGGHLAAMLAVSADNPVFEDATLGNSGQSTRVQALVDWFGPSDLLQMDADGAAQGCPLFGGTGHDHPSSPEGGWLGGKPSLLPSLAQQASPVSWVTADDPPALIQHGGRDCTVATNQSARLRDKWRASHDSSAVVYSELPNDGHGTPGFSTAANMSIVFAFVDRWLR